MIDLSKMDCSKMIDAPKIFENSNFKIIYFGTSNESYIENYEDSEDNEFLLEEALKKMNSF